MRLMVVLGMSLLALPANAQSPESTVEDTGFVITTESNLVIVPLHVYKNRKSVNDLGEESFELLEDGVVQDIAFVDGPSTDPDDARAVPTEIILLLDLSFSVTKPGLLDFNAIRESFIDGMRDNVSISIYGFAAKLRRFTGPTRDAAKLKRALETAFGHDEGQTRVFEAIMQTLRDAANRGGNTSRMLVVFSDGLSTTNLGTDLPARSALAFGIPIYPVVLGHRELTQIGSGHQGLDTFYRRQNSREAWDQTDHRAVSPELRLRDRELNQKQFADLGVRTGGQGFDFKNPNSKAMRALLSSLATVAQSEYVVGYYPRRAGDQPTARQIEVRLKANGVGKLYGGRRIVIH